MEAFEDLGESDLSKTHATFTIHVPSAQILVVNSAACQMLHFSSEELCSMKLVDLVEESQIHKFSKVYEKFLKSESCFKESNGMLLDFRKKEGDTFTGIFHFKKTENPRKCLTIVKPVEMKISWVTVDPNGNILYCDDKLGSLFYYEKFEIAGMSIFTLLPAINLSIKNDGQWKEITKQYVTGRTKYGDSFPVSLMICSGNSNAEELKVLIWVYTNIRALIILDKRLSITNFNKDFLKLLLGVSKKDIINQPIFKVIPTFSECIRFEKNRILSRENESDISYDTNESSWDEKKETFECCDETSTTCEYVPGESSLSFHFEDLTHSSEEINNSESSFTTDSEMDPYLKTLFKHRKSRAVNEEQKISNFPHSSFPHGDHGPPEEKVCMSPVMNKIGKNNSQLFRNILDNCSPFNASFIQDGMFLGFAKHSDGNLILIRYVVRTAAVNEEYYYSIFCIKKSCRFSDHVGFIGGVGFKHNSSSGDSSLLKDSSWSEEWTRQSAASLISLCDENLTAGGYSEHYTNIKHIGKGAFGYVKMAFRNSDGLLVITKFIKKHKISVRSWVFQPNLNMKMPLEVSLLRTLNHPNIVKLLDVFHNDFFVQLVMEKHGAGFDLFEFINRANCDEKLKSYIFRQITSAVHYLDSLGILHRDIKDENVIINEKFEIKLIDFGSATFIPPGKHFSRFYGTVQYGSPEVLQGKTYKGPELEIWALGVTLYILIFGDNPFYNVGEIIRAQFCIPCPISKELEHLLNRMLDKNVETRITIDEVARDPWITQPVSIENYRFEEVMRCSEEEAYPPKYVHEINAEDFYEKNPRVGRNFVEDSRDSYGSLQNSPEVDDEHFQNAQRSPQDRLEPSKSKVTNSPSVSPSTPMRCRKDRLSKSEADVFENLKKSPSPRDRSCECHGIRLAERELHSRNEHVKHFRSSSSSENGTVKEGFALPRFTCESDLEMRLKRCNLVEEVSSEASNFAAANELRNESEVYELVNENEWRKYLGVEENGGNECSSRN